MDREEAAFIPDNNDNLLLMVIEDIFFQFKDYLWVYSNGKHVVAAKTDSGHMDSTRIGKFIKFVPGGNKK